MATWNQQIADMAGTIASESTATHMDNAVKDVINKMARINPAMMYMFSGNVNNTSGNGYVSFADNNMILKVARREGSVYRTCIEAPNAMEADLIDADSLNRATAEYPRFIRSNSKIYVYPVITTANYISVTKVVYGAVTGVSSGTGAIANFPDGMYPMVVCYASMQTLLEKMSETLPAGSLQELDTLQIDGSAFSDSSNPTDAELDNPTHYFARLREFINEEEDTELSSVQLEKIKAYLTWYQTAIEKNKTDYTWMFERLRQLKENYNEFFLPYMPEQKQEQRQEDANQ